MFVHVISPFPYREELVDGREGHVLQNFLVVTDGSHLTPAENVALVEVVEEETLALARKNGYQCIFTSNSSPLTQVTTVLRCSSQFQRRYHFNSKSATTCSTTTS